MTMIVTVLKARLKSVNKAYCMPATDRAGLDAAPPQSLRSPAIDPCNITVQSANPPGGVGDREA
jgi:hypothetical protein